MLINNFSDGKSKRAGKPITVVDGAGVYRCSGMMYWLRWRDHTFDIRTMCGLLGIEEPPYFIGENPQEWKENPAFLTGFIAGIEGKNFGELMRLHDKALDETV